MSRNVQPTAPASLPVEKRARVLRDTRGVHITVVDDLPHGKELANVGQEFVAIFGAELRRFAAGRGA